MTGYGGFVFRLDEPERAERFTRAIAQDPRDVYRAAWAAARHGSTTMNTLVALGTGVAYGYSTFVTLWPGVADREVDRQDVGHLPGQIQPVAIVVEEEPGGAVFPASAQQPIEFALGQDEA